MKSAGRIRIERRQTGSWPLALALATVIISAAKVSAATIYVSGPATNPPLLFQAVGAGEWHSPGVLSDGMVVAWGDNRFGQASVPDAVIADHDIQDAVNAASDGDTVLVAPGEYDLTNQITITKAITLRSTGGAGVTFLDALNPIWCLWISNSLAVADGFTLETQNSAGGVLSYGATIQNCVFTNFTFDVWMGPGYPGKSVTMTGGTLSNSVVFYNHSPGGDIGVAVVYCTGGGLVTDCQVLANNTGPQENMYDSVEVYLGNSLMSNSVVVGVPDSAFTPGPAVRADNSTIVGCTISHNHVHDSGSGATLNNCLMDRCVIAFNSAGIGGQGGGIFETNSIIRDSLIVSNRVAPDVALDPGNYTTLGGGVYMQGGALINCTVVDNTADYCPTNINNDVGVYGYGAGVYAESGGITNCIIFDNFAAGCASAENEWYNAGPGVFDHSCTTPDPGGEGNIIQDPQFANSTNGDFTLSPASPCLAAGVVQSWMIGAQDLDGNPRTTNGAVNMGAYQSSTARMLEALIGQVKGLIQQGILNRGQGNQLETSLKLALDSLNDSNTAALCDEAVRFMARVQAMVNRGELTPAQGQSLISAASQLRSALGCSP